MDPKTDVEQVIRSQPAQLNVQFHNEPGNRFVRIELDGYRYDMHAGYISADKELWFVDVLESIIGRIELRARQRERKLIQTLLREALNGPAF